MKLHVNSLKHLKKLNLNEFFEFCKSIRYGWVDNEGKIYSEPDYKRYGVQSPEETTRKGYGICWDQTELQRWWFEHNNYQIKTFLLYYVSDDYCPSHSFLAYEDNGKWCWFEPMFHDTKVKHCGIWQYNSLDELLEGVLIECAKVAVAEGMLPESLNREKWSLYEYRRPEYGISDREFYAHCREGERIL